MSLPPPLPNAFAQDLSLEALRDRSESTALTVNLVFALLLLPLFCLLSLYVVPLMLLLWISSYAQAARLKANSVKVSAAQFPEVHAALERCRERLGNPELEAYVVQDSTFNAFAARLTSRNFVVLHSGSVDAILRRGDHEHLMFLLGHECGHVAFGHVGFLRGTLVMITAILPPLHAWYRRCQERSADRAGLWACGSRERAVRGLATLAAGAELGPKVNLPEIRRQWEAIRGEFWVKRSAFYSSYPHLIERIVLVDQAADELRVA